MLLGGAVAALASQSRVEAEIHNIYEVAMGALIGTLVTLLVDATVGGVIHGLSANGESRLGNKELEALVGHAIHARRHTYAPYSKFEVGAALLGKRGEVYLGCNVENAAYPLTICAEQSAVAHAVSEGERNFLAIAIVSSTGEPCAPCGARVAKC